MYPVITKPNYYWKKYTGTGSSYFGEGAPLPYWTELPEMDPLTGKLEDPAGYVSNVHNNTNKLIGKYIIRSWSGARYFCFRATKEDWNGAYYGVTGNDCYEQIVVEGKWGTPQSIFSADKDMYTNRFRQKWK